MEFKDFNPPTNEAGSGELPPRFPPHIHVEIRGDGDDIEFSTADTCPENNYCYISEREHKYRLQSWIKRAEEGEKKAGVWCEAFGQMEHKYVAEKACSQKLVEALKEIESESYLKHNVDNDDGSQSNHWPAWARKRAHAAIAQYGIGSEKK